MTNNFKAWKNKFYKKSAFAVYRYYLKNIHTLGKLKLDIYLLKHCITKWEGLSEENLNEYNLKIDVHRELVDKKTGKGARSGFFIDSSSCSLCYVYAEDDCKDCPIVHKTNGCQHNMGVYLGDGKFQLSAWGEFSENRNTSEMLKVLKETLVEIELIETENLK